MSAVLATRSRVLTAGAVVAAVLSVSGCGARSQLNGAAAAVLQRDATALSSAARAGNAAAVASALATLRRDVAAQRTAGGLTGARADSILAAAGRVAADRVVPAAPRSTATPAPATAAPGVVTTRPPAPSTTVGRTDSRSGHGQGKRTKGNGGDGGDGGGD